MNHSKVIKEPSQHNRSSVVSVARSILARFRKSLLSLESILLISGVLIGVWHIQLQGGLAAFVEQIRPLKAYDFSFATEFEADNRDVNIYSYFPLTNARQKVLDQTHYENVLRRFEHNESGQLIHWIADPNTSKTKYKTRVLTKSLEFDISPDLQIPDAHTALDSGHLSETEFIQVNHPEIKALWEKIKPADENNMLTVLSAIYHYTYKDIESVDFKGTTDALTTARLGVASCNGKSRLFVALARLNNIPARLVGGVILEGTDKRTSHQWVEVFVQGYWIPFGPTNGYFAALPDNYLQLYTGDQSLIRHTSNINFDYRFDTEQSLVSKVFYPGLSANGEDSQVVRALLELNMSPQTIGIVLLFPLCSLIITFLRNVVGIKTFGIFMPMLIASACFYTGLLKGAIGFTALLLFACLIYDIAERLHLLKTARLAIVLTSIVALLLSFILYADADIRFELGLLSVFPVVIISFIAERLHQSMGESEWRETFVTCLGTVFTVVVCFVIFQSMILKNLFASLPSLFLIVLALQVYLGKWSGIRLSEAFRFKKVLSSGNGCVAGINSRNRDIIYRFNDKDNLRLAADKLASKEALKRLNIPVPGTLLAIKDHSGIHQLAECIEGNPAFALKPNKGCQGNGIVVVSCKTGEEWQGAGSKLWSLDALEAHVAEILCGAYSQSGDADIAYLEPLLVQHDLINRVAPFGLSDVRIIVAKGKVINAMLRIPTQDSKGKANLHQGAIGVAVDHQRGVSTAAQHRGKNITHHPDTDISLIGMEIPFWQDILEIAEKCYEAIPLGYLGVDICIDQALGPLVLEVNGRPGLEIQNVNDRGFYNDFMEKAHA